ncbi:MAG: peptidoglycan DD-metalloendopeptidase family protein [Spirochaetales bacterium]|nr:peptidoglycan DD-metalloendopeptidase family protein [Spirochaetales bacterium]
MARDYYDDMHDRNSSRRKRRRGPSGTLLGVVVLGIAVCVAVIFLWLRFSVPEEAVKPEAVIEEQPPVAEEPVPPPGPSEPVVQAQRLDARPPSSTSVRFTTHVVQAGEDLNSIAGHYGLKVQTLVSINEIRNVQAVTDGTSLKIPDRDGHYYTVREGDMLSTIVWTLNLPYGWATLQELNGLANDQIKAGQKLFIQDTSSTASSQYTDIAPVQFIKPAPGTILVRFDQESGVRIRTSKDEPVKAAADGEVADTGFEADGQSRYIILSHEGGYRTGYHNLSTVEASGGDSVAQGDLLGLSGEPHLFFTIEQLGIPLDPEQFF